MHIRREGLEVIVNPGAAAAAYTSGDVVGTIQEIPNAVLDTKGMAVLRNVIILDADDQKKDLDIFIFNQLITVAADNAAFAPTYADLQKLVARVQVVTADYQSNNSKAIALKSMEVLLPAFAKSKSLWAVFVTRSTPTSTANGLQAKLILEKY